MQGVELKYCEKLKVLFKLIMLEVLLLYSAEAMAASYCRTLLELIHNDDFYFILYLVGVCISTCTRIFLLLCSCSHYTDSFMP